MMKRITPNQNLHKSKQGQIIILTSEANRRIWLPLTIKATNELEGLVNEANLIMEFSEIGDAHKIAKINKVTEFKR